MRGGEAGQVECGVNGQGRPRRWAERLATGSLGRDAGGGERWAAGKAGSARAQKRERRRLGRLEFGLGWGKGEWASRLGFQLGLVSSSILFLNSNQTNTIRIQIQI